VQRVFSQPPVAQSASTGYSSYVDLVYTDAYSRPLELVTQCMTAAPEAITALECFHNMEIIDGAAFEECNADELGPCGKRFAYPTPFYPEAYGQMVKGVYDEIYKRYYANVLKYANQELFPCLFSFCDGVCLLNATKNITRHAYGSLNTVYWEEIFAASLKYLNTTLWYYLPFPGYGTIILPIFSDKQNPQQYIDYAERINALDAQDRGVPYGFTSPGYTDQRVPFEPSETAQGLPGLYAFEELKNDLEPATLLEYQQFGFSTVIEFYGDNETMVVEPVWCLGALPLPWIRRALTKEITVAEGYTLPNTAVNPWVPVASPTSALNLTAFLTLSPEPPPVTSAKPLSEVLVCEPMTYNNLALIDVLDTTGPATEPSFALGQSGPQVEAVQYLLRNNLLSRYGTKEERDLIREQMGANFLPNIEATGNFDQQTSEALGFVQGKGNLGITGLLDSDTLGLLGSSACPGAKGDTVLALQAALESKGIPVGRSGIFDAATQAGVISLQQQAGLKPTGNLDRKTWLALFSQ
jgi:peptidoglycan hydrolase-like protein with peptidoglycan-binding domain